MTDIENERSYLDPAFDYQAWDPLSYLPPVETRVKVRADLHEVQNLCVGMNNLLNLEGIHPGPRSKNNVFGMEVGDDRIDISRDPRALAMALVCQERVLDMKTSKADTYISNAIWNFTEVTNSIPCAPEGSFHHARRVGNFKDLEYTDTVILRLIVDCSKGDSSHSSTAVGKAGMLASRLNTPRSEHRSDLHLASYLQDASLRTGYSPDPKYLPNIMGGSGARALFDNPVNLYLSVKAYRGGGYDRLYGSATQEAIQCLGRLDRGKGATPVLCSRLRDRQEYLHGTYADKILIPPERFKKRGVVALPDPLYESVGSQNMFQAVEQRLVRTKALIGRREAEREVEKTLKTHDALIGMTSTMYAFEKWKQARSIARRKFDSALQANSAFSRLLARCANGTEVETLIKQGFLSVGCGVTAFTKWDAKWLFSGGKGEAFSIENLTTTEDMFIRSEVSTEESFKVGGIPLSFTTHGKTRVEETSCRVGLYQINSDMLSWSNKVLEDLRERREIRKEILRPTDLLEVFNKDLEWVNDDTLLVAQCLHDTEQFTKFFCVALVSDDRRLANQMANTANVNVYRISPRDVVTALPHKSWNSQTVIDVGELWALHWINIDQQNKVNRPRKVYIDSGSVSAFCARYSRGMDGEGTEVDKIYRRELISYGRDHDGRRYSQYRIAEQPVTTRVRVETFRPIARTKRYRWGKPLDSVYHADLSNRRSSWSNASSSQRRLSFGSSVAA